MAPPFTLSKDNIEQQFAVNHLGKLLFLYIISSTLEFISAKIFIQVPVDMKI